MPHQEAAMPTGTWEEYVAIDLETTGLFAETDRIVEVGAVRFDSAGRERGRYQRLVNPGRPMSPAAQRVHGIPDTDLLGQPRADVVLPELLGFLADPATTVLLAHNARFDAGFLGRELARLGRPLPPFQVIDTLALARHRLPGARDHRLESLAAHLGLAADGLHRALADSVLVKDLWLALRDEAWAPVLYPIYDPAAATVVPTGWTRLAEAIAGSRRVKIEYSGGSRGVQPREISPRRFSHRGGITYVVAFCHLDGFEKSFRLDRVVRYEVLVPASLERVPAPAPRPTHSGT
jgi:DNA polymerase III epsilon subunit family exonuclease